MHPTLFHLFGIRIDTYSVIWFIALSIAIIWVIKRLEIYELDEYESRRVMAVSFFFMLIGATLFKKIRMIPYMIENPSYLLNFFNWGISEFGAILGAFISALVMCLFSRKVSFMKLCDAAMPPAILSIAIGRWGCFFNGCCVGITSKFFTAVHFPFDKIGVTRHPVQIYYSLIAFVIVGFLLLVERKILPLQKKKYYSVIAPLGMLCYALMRFSVAPVRERRSLLYMIQHYERFTTYPAIAFALPFVLIWLAYSLYKLKSLSQE